MSKYFYDKGHREGYKEGHEAAQQATRLTHTDGTTGHGIDMDDYDLETVEGYDDWCDAMQSHNGHELVVARTTGGNYRAATLECVTCNDFVVAVLDTRHVYFDEFGDRV